MTSNKGEELSPGNLKSPLTRENYVRRPICSMRSPGAQSATSGD
uniref:Apolipoprotein B mRNA editing enzyme, catalytic polypeptide 1 n=1 Tax=Jaculus jaculus TaxID=51337 RepID=A0A8C5P489_JACJA